MSSEAISASSSVAAQQSQVSSSTQQGSSQSAIQQLEQTKLVERAQDVKETAERKGSEESPTLDELDAAVTQINTLMKEGQRSVAFNLDRDSGQVVVRVTNTQTDEVIRQIPNEDALRFAKNLEGMMGMIFNEKA